LGGLDHNACTLTWLDHQHAYNIYVTILIQSVWQGDSAGGNDAVRIAWNFFFNMNPLEVWPEFSKRL
jgi:hypothetical protein